MQFKLGLIHTPAPASTKALARLPLPMPPPEADWHAKCPPDGDALGNDQFGCCVPCAQYRAMEMRMVNAWGSTWKPTREMVLALYAQLTGFDPATGGPDEGTDTNVAMDHWSHVGVPALNDTDYVQRLVVNPLNMAQVRAAIALLGPVQVSVALPNGLDANPLGPWVGDKGLPGSLGYHRVMVGKYDQNTFTARTWGYDVTMDLSFWLKYVVAVDATASREWMSALTGLSASGLTWEAIEALV